MLVSFADGALDVIICFTLLADHATEICEVVSFFDVFSVEL
jgi:hypothetical protein